MKKQPIIQNHSIKSVIVIGAGLAGLTAALEGAVESGERVSRLIIFSKNENLK